MFNKLLLHLISLNFHLHVLEIALVIRFELEVVLLLERLVNRKVVRYLRV